jgi:hypothetical protein
MVARSYLVLQALTLLKLARVSRNPRLAAFAADKAAKLQARLDETVDARATTPAIGNAAAPRTGTGVAVQKFAPS